MDRNNILCKIEFHESEWVGEMGDYIVINTSLRTIVNRVNKLIKKEAESNSSPVRLYASNAYTSLKLLSEALWEHKKEVDNHDYSTEPPQNEHSITTDECSEQSS